MRSGDARAGAAGEGQRVDLRGEALARLEDELGVAVDLLDLSEVAPEEAGAVLARERERRLTRDLLAEQLLPALGTGPSSPLLPVRATRWPPGSSTRASSASASPGSGTSYRTLLARAQSKLASANGSARRSASTARIPRAAVISTIRGDQVDSDHVGAGLPRRSTLRRRRSAPRVEQAARAQVANPRARDLLSRSGPSRCSSNARLRPASGVSSAYSAAIASASRIQSPSAVRRLSGGRPRAGGQ